MTSEPTVYIVDTDVAARRGLASALKASGLRCKVFKSAGTFLKAIRGHECGCVLMNFRLKRRSGLELLDRLGNLRSALMVIVMASRADVPMAVECMKRGAMDFLGKPVDHETLLLKIEDAISRSEVAQLSRAEAALGQSRLTGLSARERDVLQMLVAGKSSKQIAAEIRLSLRTVSNHRAHLLAKTGAENTADLVRMAVTADLVKPRQTPAGHQGLQQIPTTIDRE